MWHKIETLDHPILDDREVYGIDGKLVPASHESHEVLLTDGSRIWVGRSMIMGGARIKWAGRLATHWMDLPRFPEE